MSHYDCPECGTYMCRRDCVTKELTSTVEKNIVSAFFRSLKETKDVTIRLAHSERIVSTKKTSNDSIVFSIKSENIFPDAVVTLCRYDNKVFASPRYSELQVSSTAGFDINNLDETKIVLKKLNEQIDVRNAVVELIEHLSRKETEALTIFE